MSKQKLVGVTSDQWQRRPLKLPKGDVRLADGRALRRIIGYDLSKVKFSDATLNGFLASAYNIQEASMGQHEVTYTITPFGARYRCNILVDNYPIEKNFFYHLRDAEMWCRKQVETLRANLK